MKGKIIKLSSVFADKLVSLTLKNNDDKFELMPTYTKQLTVGSGINLGLI